jgi:2,4-dienoyl-CoA reductase-like NADH-dependent reductase (Old Yellow Enzyme family)
MEAWHEPYASQRQQPLLAASKPPLALRPAYRRAPIHVMTADDIRAMAVQYGECALWAREAGYDGLQLASSNAKLLDQLLSPFWNRRDDEFGGSLEKRASILRLIRERIAERAGEDFTVTVKVPVGEKAPPFTKHTTWDEGIALCRLVEDFGYDSVTPVEVSVFPDTTLSRGGIPSSLWKNKAMQTRFRTASPRRTERAVLQAGYVWGGVTAPFKPVWNRSRFIASKAAVSIPVLAVGGIRDAHEVEEILEGGQADLVGIGRPFYAEADLAERILGGRPEPGLCRYSNLCVPAQMLGMKGGCYNPEVIRARRAAATDQPA